MNVVWPCLILIFTFANGATVVNKDSYSLSIVHFNDFHARFEETSPTSSKCMSNVEPCIGGFPRLYTVISKLKKAKPNALILNAGDSFQGTLWYNIFRWNVTQQFMNLLPLDAHTLGNHEFDHGIAGVVPYLKAINSPMVVCNIDDSQEPDIQNLYKKSIIVERKGRKIGIIGVIAQNTNELANTEKLKFLDEASSVKLEADKLANQGVDIIIVLSHCGVDVDRIIAQNAGSNIDIIVGGHSHSLLHTGVPPNGETPVDVYPIVVQQKSGASVLIVQASAYTKYIGDITLLFDDNGKIKEWNGNTIYIDNTIEQDKNILKLMEPFIKEINVVGKREIGVSKVQLSRAGSEAGECNLGNFVTDAFVDNFVEHAEEGYWTYASAAFINQGGLRTDINKGTITYEDIIISQPFANTLNTFDIKGKYLLDTFEFSVNASIVNDKLFSLNLLQYSGFRIIFNVTKPVGERVVEALIRCAKCDIPTYSPIEPETTYRIISSSFILSGGGAYVTITDNKMNEKAWDIDSDVLEKYIKKQSPITQGIDGRMIILM